MRFDSWDEPADRCIVVFKVMNMRYQTILLLICATVISCPTYADDYQAMRIVAPEPETTIHDNNGNLDVKVAVLPRLRAGDRLTLLLDDLEISWQRPKLSRGQVKSDNELRAFAVISRLNGY
jgi:hypothetical protein